MYRLFIYLSLMCVAGSCTIQKYLPAGKRLYRGATIKVLATDTVAKFHNGLKNQLNLAVKPTANKFVFNYPYKLWWWYIIGQPKHPKGIRAFFRNKLGEPPVFSSNINAAVTARNMQYFLNNLGYFNAEVAGDTVNTRYLTKAIYTAVISPPYTIKKITWLNDTLPIVQLVAQKQQNGILKIGNRYRLSDIQAERDRLDLFLKTKGYYYFNPGYIVAYADTTKGDNGVHIYLGINRSAPLTALQPFTINQVSVFPNYTLLLPPPDTSRKGMMKAGGLLIGDTIHKFNPSLFEQAITYRPGALYNSRQHNTSLNRLINIGTFKFVKSRYERTADTTNPYQLNVFYYLTPAKKKSIEAQAEAFSKENRFLGTRLSVSWRNKNVFKSAELLQVKVYSGFEFTFVDTLRNSNNFRLGAEASLSLPRFYVPFIKIKEQHLYPPHTRLLLGYEIFRKQFFYTKKMYRFQYEFNWKQGSNKEHIFSPVGITYIKPTNVSDTFAKQTIINPALSANLYNEIILGSFYSYTRNTANPFAIRQLFFNVSIDLAGNVAGLISNPLGPRQKSLFNTPFSQFVKADADIRYQKKMPKNITWVSRLQVGAGIPYGNSNMLPFSKQYVIGGGTSLRGFRMRQLGPGSYQPTRFDQVYFMVIGGDYKLQFNTELRIPIFAKFSGALFVDAGNIWTKDTLLYGKAGQLKKDFYNELAVAAGFGLRFDAGLILIRADLGFALRKPYLPPGERWIVNQMQFGNSEWRKQNMVLNLALGFPF